MKIALTTKGETLDSPMDPRFGRAAFVLFYDDNTEELTLLDNRESANAAHGAGPQLAQKIADYQPDLLITGNGPGENAAVALKALNLKILVGAGSMTVREALDAYRNKGLQEFSG